MEFPGLYSFPIFKPEIIKKWLAEIEHINRFLRDNCMPNEPPNDYNNHGLMLDNFDFDIVITALIL